jgi:hypothetical protein
MKQRRGNRLFSTLLITALLWLAAGGHAPRLAASPPARPALATQEDDPEILFEKRIGTSATTCGAGTTLDTLPGSTVYYCYRVTNNKAVPLQVESLVDDFVSAGNPGVPIPVSPGTIIPAKTNGQAGVLELPFNGGITRAVTAGSGSSSAIVSTSSTARLTLSTVEEAPAIIVEESTTEFRITAVSSRVTVGSVEADQAACSTTTIANYNFGSSIFFCLTIQNTGQTTLTHHAVTFAGLNASVNLDNRPIGPEQTITLTHQTLTNASNGSKSLQLTLQANTRVTATVVSRSAAGSVTATGSAQANLLSFPSVTLQKFIATAPGDCPLTASSINIVFGTNVYYCLVVTNNSSSAFSDAQFQ